MAAKLAVLVTLGEETNLFTSRSALFVASALLSVALAATEARADDVCSIQATRDVAAVDHSTTMMQTGNKRDSITQYQYSKSTKEYSFCQHGGYCWPETVSINGREVTAVKLLNCAVDRRHPSVDADTITYELAPNRQSIAPKVMKESDVADQFMRMGLCHACAQNVAAFYIQKPASACGRLAKQALEGNQDALALLNGDKQPGPTCDFWH